MQLDASAVMWSSPERERAGRPLIVLLHGLGSHEGDLFALAPALPLDAVVASPRAPLREGPGWAWFPRTAASADPTALRQGSAETIPHTAAGAPDPSTVDAAASAVLAWLDGLDTGPVTLIGFSQGGALALQLLRHAPDRFTATANLSGFVASDAHPGDAALAAVRPRVFWGRGDEDPVIPATAIERTAAWLPAHVDATVREYPRLGHSIANEELRDLVAFLRG